MTVQGQKCKGSQTPNNLESLNERISEEETGFTVRRVNCKDCAELRKDLTSEDNIKEGQK